MIGREVKFADDFREDAKKSLKNFGRTALYSSGIPSLNYYLGGGYGNAGEYEIVLLYGATGVGKSSVALNMIAEPIKRGVKVGIMALEDHRNHVLNRLEYVLGDEYNKAVTTRTIRMFSDEALDREWSLDDLAEEIEAWYTDPVYGVDLILLDHLQFAFEGAEQIRGENEWIAQRKFMKRLNKITSQNHKTMVLVSHVSKAGKGLDRVAGSGAIAGAATKAIEIKRRGDQMLLLLDKSRFTATRPEPHTLLMDKVRLMEVGR